MPIQVLTLIGTRPEAIKLAPLVLAMHRRPVQFAPVVCLTGQHRDLVHNILPAFGIAPDHDLAIMSPGQTLSDATARILKALQNTFATYRPDLVVVQGDTTTAFAGALAAFYSGVAVAHIEAGLRTNNIHSPFPEEMNRRLVSRLATYHFAPTIAAAENLYREGISKSHVWVTGNTAIDAVRLVKTAPLPCPVDPKRKLILVTAHRRENVPRGLRNIAEAVKTLASRNDVQVIWPVHPNPEIRAAIASAPADCLTSPIGYHQFATLMRRAHLILSDSGGIQEEAPALGKPVLVLRDTTERPEGVQAGATLLVGTDPQRIVDEATRLLDDVHAYAEMARTRDIYGDGRASERICAALVKSLAVRQAQPA